jgi:preprotein translocase subunit SecF
MHIFKGTNFDFLRWRWQAIALSWIIIIAGVVVFMTKGIPLGIEFAGGTAVIVEFQQPTSVQQVRAAMDKSFPGGGANVIVQTFGDPSLRQIMIRVPHVGAEQGTSLSSAKQQVMDALAKGGVGTPKENGTQIVGPAVGQELRSKALWAVLFSLGGILLYVGIRYEFKFAVGAVIALFHDVFAAFGVICFMNREISLTVIAALLTLAGYSINDTIVVFDRIRERSKQLHKLSHEDMMNTAMNETLSRTIITSLTVFLAVLSLYLFGGEVINDFALCMLAGVIFGTYSSIYVASALALDIWIWLDKRKGVARVKAA